MKKYEEAKIEVIDIDHKDIIVSSPEEGEIPKEPNFDK